MQSYLFTNCYEDALGYTQLLSLIASHPNFKSKVNQFKEIFPYKLQSEGIIKMGTLIYAFLLPDYPRNLQRKLAVELLQSLQISAQNVTLTTLSQFLLRICADLVENIDVASAVAVLDMIESRIVDHYILDVQDPTYKRKLQTSIKLEIFDCEAVLRQSLLPEKFHRKAGELIYYEEKLQFEENIQLIPTQILTKQLKEKPEEVIPLGYVYQQFVFQYTDNNFQTKHSYRLKGNKTTQVVDKVDYWVSLDTSAGNSIRDFIVNQQIFMSSAVISSAHLPEELSPAPSKKIDLYRINPSFAKQSYYQNLKEITAEGAPPSSKYFNVLSEYFDRDEYNIDELALTKQKLAIRRQEHILGITGKESVKKEVKDYENQMKMLPNKINTSKVQYRDDSRMQEMNRQLMKLLRPSLEEGKNINTVIEKHLSCEQKLPRDSADTFNDDIMNLRKIDPMQILIFGRAKSGKTTLAKAVAQHYNLVYISIESCLDKVMSRANNFKENPPEPDEDGNIIDGLMKIEECIIEDLEKGKKVEDQDILDLVNLQMKREFTESRGFILDLPIECNIFWYKCIIENKIYTPKTGCRFFNRIIQIDQTEEEWHYFLNGLKINPQDSTTSSALDRYLLAKPKPPPEEGEEEPEDDGQKSAPLIEDNLIQVKWSQAIVPFIEHLSMHIHPTHWLKVKNSYQSLQECLDWLKPYLYKIPLPKRLEGSEKQLLSVGLDEQKISRKWSPWGIIDCLELTKKKLVLGKFENAAEYGGRVFIFENEDNLNKFVEAPRKYLLERPKLPETTNICIAGPRKSGKKILAESLSKIYGLKIIDFTAILKKVIMKQKEDETHIPSNPDVTSRSVHLSEPEFKQFYKGGMINGKDILPMILFELGIPLQKKPVGWGVENDDQEAGQQPVEEKKPAKKAKKKQKIDQDKPLEDIQLKQMIPQLNHKKKLNEIRGYILIGYPHNEDQLNALKAFNIPVDKFILLSDNSEQSPFSTLGKRLSEYEMQQASSFITAIGSVKQALGEENCKQITDLSKSPEEILNQIRQFIDPFYAKCDDDTINRVCADKQEDGDPIPMGFCGDYCPVVLKDGWLVKGKEEFEAGFQGRRFKFAGENQLNAFKENPVKYLDKSNLEVAPRTMFMGVRGVGLRTQLLRINQHYKIPILNFKQTLLQWLASEKDKRKMERYFNKGFKIPEFDEQGNKVEDPELTEESPDFDRATLEVQLTKRMFQSIHEVFINGNFYDVQEQTVATPLVDLLAQSRRLPQVVFILKSNEPKWLERNLDIKKIEEELDQIKQKRRKEKAEQREEARKQAEEQGEEYEQPPPEDQEEDPEIPKLDDLITQKSEQLKTQRQADLAKLEQFADAFKALNVEVVEINCERGQKHVFDRINYSLKPLMDNRINRWEQNSMLAIQRHRAPDFINNYIAQESRFGQLNPFTLIKPVKAFPLVYNDRIYYLNDEDQRDNVMRNPTLLNSIQPPPSDVLVVPSVSVIGKVKVGKTTLAKNLSQKLGLIYISIQSLLEQFTLEHKDYRINQILSQLALGKQLSNEMAVDLIYRRLSMGDCQRYGWVLDSFPSNKTQCDLLYRKGLLPANVFSLKLSEWDIKNRVIKHTKGQQIPAYDFDIQVVHSRLAHQLKGLLQVQLYFQEKYDNIEFLNGNTSKWGLFEVAQKKIRQKVRGRKQFIKAFVTHSATPAKDIGLHFNCIMNHLSGFKNFSPISYKLRRQYIKLCPKYNHHLALYEDNIYLFSSESEMKDFIANPENYRKQGNNFCPPTIVSQDMIPQLIGKVENRGYCSVELVRNKLAKGNANYITKYKQKYYMSSTASSAKLFIKNPVRFEMAKTADKLPVEFEKKSDLKKIARQNDCTAFLQHHLSNILMKCLAQLGYRRPKYPSLGSKQSALKFLSISLKATNPNKDETYREKYTEKLNNFIKQCSYSQQIRDELNRKDKELWQDHDEQNLLKLCEQYNQFIQNLNSEDKNKYFSRFIR